MQSYILGKDLFTTLDKGKRAFRDANFRAVGMSQDVLSAMLDANMAGSGGRVKRRRILAALKAVENRLSRTLRGAAKSNFGVRQEYRVLWPLFLDLAADEGPLGGDEDEDEDEFSTTSSFHKSTVHLPYTQLPLLEYPCITLHTKERPNFLWSDGFEGVTNLELETLLQKSRDTLISLEAEFEKRPISKTSSQPSGIDGYGDSLRKGANKIEVLERLTTKLLSTSRLLL